MDSDDFDAIQQADVAKSAVVFRKFIEKHANTFDLTAFTQSGQWPTIWSALFSLLADPKAPSVLYEDCLHVLRILSRDRTHLNATTSAQFDTLLRLADLGGVQQPDALRMPDAVLVEALKTMCNLVFQSTRCQQMCLRNSAIVGIVRRLRTTASTPVAQQLQYFDMKLLFIITALNEAARPKVRDDFYGLTYLPEALDIIVQRNTVPLGAADGDDQPGAPSPTQPPRLADLQVDYVCEVLKVLFNITFRPETAVRSEEDEVEQLRRMAGCLHDLLRCRTMNRDKQQELCSHTVNLLTNIPTGCYTELVTDIDDMEMSSTDGAPIVVFEGYDVQSLDILLTFLRQRLTAGENKTRIQQRELLTPVLVVLLKAVRCAPVQRRYVRSRILPPLRGDDVRQRPEVGGELRNQLCRLLTTAEVHVRDLAAELLFVLCKENVWRMTKYTGYGNAAGMFANRGLLGGGDATAAPADRCADGAAVYSSDSEDSDTEEYKRVQHEINPVLGSVEPPRSGDPFAGMSDEQREHEAMQLVGLMEKLHRRGIVQPCRVGDDGRPVPVQHVLELLEPAAAADSVPTVKSNEAKKKE